MREPSVRGAGTVDASLSEAYRGRRVLVTGHSGFKGGWLSFWLDRLGAKVAGIALPPPAGPSLFDALDLGDRIDSRFADIRDATALRATASGLDAEMLFHLAAQPIVRRSHLAPADTFATNVVGTANLLDLARTMPSLRAVIVVTSDKCYDNLEWWWPYREGDRLGGTDPYSASKACTEIVAESYRRLWFGAASGPQLATARAGNVIGGGDWAEDRLIPDIVRAAASRQPMLIRNPRSVRPWQHVFEPLYGYLMLGARLMGGDGGAFGGAWNFGPGADDELDVETIARTMIACLPGLDVPVRFGGEGNAAHEARILRLDSSKARAELGWRPRLSTNEAVALTADWYAAHRGGSCDMRALSLAQLDEYRGAARALSTDEELRACA